MKAEIDIDVIMRLLKPQSSNKLIKKSLEVFKTSKDSRKKQICLYVISIMVATFVGISKETVSVMVDTTQAVLDVMLGLFGIVFTGYAFFQALINKELLIRMVINVSNYDKEGAKSKLQETNESFVECMMLNLIAIIVSLLLKIIINSMPEDFIFFSKLEVNNIVATFFISLYFYFILIIIWEVKSFVFNVFQLFNMHAGTRVLELFNDKDE